MSENHELIQLLALFWKSFYLLISLILVVFLLIPFIKNITNFLLFLLVTPLGAIYRNVKRDESRDVLFCGISGLKGTTVFSQFPSYKLGK